MNRHPGWWGVATVMFGLALSSPLPAQNGTGVQDAIRQRLEGVGADADLTASGATIHAAGALRAFYEDRIYRPVWIHAAGGVADLAAEFVRELDRVDTEGLRATDYHRDEIRRLTRRAAAPPVPPLVLADLELLLTDAFLLVGSHLLMGRVNPETIDPEWLANRRGEDLTARLGEAEAAGSVAGVLQRLRPPQPGYRQLVEARSRYQALVGVAWPALSTTPAPDEDPDDRRRAVRARLRLLGDVELPTDADSTAVRRYQRRHGLVPTGQADSSTVASLNVTPAVRLQQIDLNLERWRWLPADLGARHIIVNIAAFEMYVVEGGARVLSMRAIVGRDYRRTPVFTESMTYLVLAPYWHVPRSIAVRDKLPLIKRHPGYLRQQRYRVFAGWGADALEVDPDTVNWAEVSATDLPYRLRQDPGPFNALGDVKFMFPNRFNVYLHDTPQRELFGETERIFSSGCIRLERPMELAEYLLRDQPAWSAAAIRTAVAGGVETTVRLTQPIPVHLLYWTAWVDEEGTIQFRRDVYGRDTRLRDALRQEPPP